MDEIYKDSIATIYTYIYVNETLSNADGAVTVSIYDNDTGELLLENQPTNNPSIGEYSYLLPASITSQYGTYKAVWTYTVDAVTLSPANYFQVVVPYVTLGEVQAAHAELATLTFDDFKNIERSVRQSIEAYTNQIFAPKGAQVYRIYGVGSDYLNLPERLYSLEYVARDFPRQPLYDLNVINGQIMERDPDGALVSGGSAVAQGPVEIVTWNEQNPHVIQRKYGRTNRMFEGFTFRDREIYLVRGEAGWESVPSPVNQAAKVLVSSSLAPEFAYHEKGIDVVRASDYRLEFTENPYETTGNILADQLLADYINIGVHIF